MKLAQPNSGMTERAAVLTAIQFTRPLTQDAIPKFLSVGEDVRVGCQVVPGVGGG